MGQTLTPEKYVQLPTFKVILTLQNYIAKLFVRVHHVLYDVFVCTFRLVWSIYIYIYRGSWYIMRYCISNRCSVCCGQTPFHHHIRLILTSDYASFFCVLHRYLRSAEANSNKCNLQIFECFACSL